jgi:hypothetical protein
MNPSVVSLLLLLSGIPRFEEVSESSGIDFVNMFGGIDTKGYILETTGSGAVFFDYDEDGDQDLFLINGTRLGYGEAQSHSNALFRNLGGGRFENVTSAAGLEGYGWGQGGAAADIDNDSDLDLLVTYYGPSRLYRNEGDGTFTETGASAGVAPSGWGTSAAFADYDRDGVNDLFIARYIDFDPEKTPGPGGAPNCFFLGIAVMCGPRGLPPAHSLLYHGLGGFRFEDVSGRSGVAREPSYGLGAVWGDLDNDGDVDLYVANDQMANYLYRNDGGGRFEDIALETGVAYNEDGRAQAGMGVDLGDYDRDGWLDIHKTNFSHDYNTLYRNTGRGYFEDVSYSAGIVEATYLYLGWGTGFRDFDRDGWLDLFVANGHVYPEVGQGRTESDYAQSSLLFFNLGDGRFEERREQTGPDLRVPRVSRGAAFADYDDDGDIDVAVTNMNGPVSLLRNESAPGAHWVGFRLIGRESARDALGARVTIEAGGQRQMEEVRSGASYLSSSDPRVFFGLGSIDRIDRIEVRWPRGRVQVIEGAPLDRYSTMVEGLPIEPR